MYGISTTLQKKLGCPFNSIYFDDSTPVLTNVMLNIFKKHILGNSYISIARWNVEWFLINVSNILKVSHENYIITNMQGSEFLSFEIELQN